MVEQELFDTVASETWARPGSGDDAAALVAFLGSKGLPARIVSLARADELRAELEGRHAGGELDEGFHRECLTQLAFTPPDDFPDARSIVVAAVPRPETAAVFEVGGVARKLTIPPTYTDYHVITRRWLEWLGAILAGAGYRAAGTVLPLKLLATRSGLAAYGRNNISFVPGLGSYFELVAAYTDIPCPSHDWKQPAMLDRCLGCHACVNSCPTGAIRRDRFLLATERCLVLHNERPGEVPFPGWIDRSAHRTLIGCMECQWVCPENRGFRGWVGSTESFSADETGALMAGAHPADLQAETVTKLQRLGLLRFEGLLERNLNAALL